jgi:two-component system KDP operon response regulator KdpE
MRRDELRLTASSPKKIAKTKRGIPYDSILTTTMRVLQVVWGPDHAEQTENLRVMINQLRKKIEKDPAHPRYILTEPWLGYRFQFPSITSEKRPRRKS